MQQARNDGTIAFTDGPASAIVDERARPVLVTTWFGEATEPLIDEYFDWLDARLARARASSERLVLLNDTFAVERPTPVVRKRLAERVKGIQADGGRTIVGTVAVIENALVRGTVTALGWVFPSLSRAHFVESIDEAVERAVSLVENAGMPPPAEWARTGYRRPTRP